MKCPVCEHETGKALLKCSECETPFDRETLEQYEHLAYLLTWLGERHSILAPDVQHQLADAARQQQQRLAQRLGLKQEAPPAEVPAHKPAQIDKPLRPATSVMRDLTALRLARRIMLDQPLAGSTTLIQITQLRDLIDIDLYSLEQELAGRRISVVNPTNRAALAAFSTRFAVWKAEKKFTADEVDAIEIYLASQKAALDERQDKPVSAAHTPAAVPARKATITAPAAKTVHVRKEQKPPSTPITTVAAQQAAKLWATSKKKLGDAAASGMLLNALLYLGAFMFVVSAGILVLRFWDTFPPAVQLLVIAALPASFYLLGWLGRAKLKLPNAGRVLTYVGVLLVPVDFAAIYQFGGLAGQVNFSLYWFIASLISTAIFILTTRSLPTQFMGYVTLLGLTSIFTALVSLIGLSVQWQIAAVAFSALLMLILALRLLGASDKWHSPAKSAQWLPILLLPAAQLCVLLVPGGRYWAMMVTFVIAAAGYALLGWTFEWRPRWRALFTHISAWSSVGAVALLALAVQLPSNWYAAAAAVISAAYIVAGRLFDRRLPADLPARSYTVAAFYAPGAILLLASIALGLAAVSGEQFDPTVRFWAGVVALTLATAVIVTCAALFRSAWFLLAGGALFILPFSLTFGRLLLNNSIPQWIPWLMLAWTGLALLYLLLARFLPFATPFGLALNFCAQILILASAMGLIHNYRSAPASWFPIPTLFVLAAVFLFYLVSAIIHDGRDHPIMSGLFGTLAEPIRSSIFMWPLAFILPLWLAIAWYGSIFSLSWLAPVLAALALAYVALGQFLYRYRATYRLPFHVFAYILPPLGIYLALGVSWPLLITLLITVATLAAISFIYDRALETAVAAVLFIWPFHLALTISTLSAYAYTLAYALLGSLIYIPLAQILQAPGYRLPWRFDPAQAPALKEMPRARALFLTGYAIAGAAVIASLVPLVNSFPGYAPWIAVAVPAIITILMLFSLYRFRTPSFAWLAVLLFTITFGQTLTWLRVPPSYDAVAWITLALLFMFGERFLNRGRPSAWLVHLRYPLGIGSIILCALGLALTAPATIRVLAGYSVELPIPLILAQSIAVLLILLAARLYRSQWPLFLEPLLIFFPVTLFFASYGRILFGQPFTAQTYTLIWITLALIHLFIAAILDSRPVRYAYGLYLGGYLIALLALFWSIPDATINIIVLGLTLLIAAASQILFHFGRHHTYEAFTNLIWRKPGTVAQRAASVFFLFYTAYLFPVWLARFLLFNNVSTAWLGVSFALTAPLYIALGLYLRRIKKEYTWPLFSAGYALTAIGAMIAINNELLFIAVLCLNLLVYAASAYIYKQPAWLYLSNSLLPIIILLILNYNEQLVAAWVAAFFMLLAFFYVAIGRMLDRRLAPTAPISPYALPFFILGYLLSALSLAVGSSEQILAIAIFSAGVFLYAASAWMFKETIFIYPAAWLAAVPYILIMSLTPLAPSWYGVGLVPFILLYIAIGRFYFHGRNMGINGLRSFLASLAQPAQPFYLIAYAFSIGMIAVSGANMLPLTIALIAASAIYFASGALFRHTLWHFAALFAAHLAIITGLSIRPSEGPIYNVSLAFIPVCWLLVFIGLVLARRLPAARIVTIPRRQFKIWRRELSIGGWPSAVHLLSASWSQPFFIFAAVDIILWQIVALGRYETTISLAVSSMLLLGLLATHWQDGALAYESLIFLTVGVAAALSWSGLPAGQILPYIAGLGLLLYGVARLISLISRRLPVAAIWLKPLERSAVVLTVIAVFGSLIIVNEYPFATAGAFAIAGILYLTMAYRGQRYALGYFAVALLEFAWVVILISQSINQPQLFAIPAGLYLIGIGAMERRRQKLRYANYLEIIGLAIMLVTTFIQSLNLQGGFPYFLLLIIESLLAIGWGAWRKVKAPFFMGLSAAFLNVIAQLVLVSVVDDVWRWVIIGATAILLMSTGILYEMRKEQLALKVKEWRVELQEWS